MMKEEALSSTWLMKRSCGEPCKRMQETEKKETSEAPKELIERAKKYKS